MQITLLLFARAKDLAGADRIQLEVPEGSEIRHLRAELVHRCPEMSVICNSLLWAVNNQYAAVSSIVRSSDTVACFPPVSGG
jgi:molybdopterin converting factor subunit 1